MLRQTLALILTLLAGGWGYASAAEQRIAFNAVEATNEPGSHLPEAADGSYDSPNGWRVSPGGPQSAVFRPLSRMAKGKLRIYLALYGNPVGDLSGELSLSVTSDAHPSLAGSWEPLFPVILLTDKGELNRDGYRFRIEGKSINPFIRIDSILIRDVTAVKVEFWPAANAPHPLVLTEVRGEWRPGDSSNIALGCPVTASHEVGGERHPQLLTDGLLGTFSHPAQAHPPGKFFFEIDLGRVATLDHVSLINRAEGATMGRLTRLHLQLFDEAPGGGSAPVWSAQDRADGTSPEPGAVDIVPASAGQGMCRGRYVRISSDSMAEYSPQLAEVQVYEAISQVTAKVTADGQSIPVTDEIRIPRGADRVVFTLVQPDLPKRLGAQARIAGIEDYWRAVYETETLEYRDLPPGQYALEARLRHSDDQWCSTVLHIPLIVESPWLPKSVVQVGVVLLALAIGALGAWGIVRHRLHKRLVELERRQELSNERRRIARDMHDVVGSRLTQLAVMHELYATQSDLPVGARDRLKELTKTAREAIASLDETVWAINPRNDTLQGLTDYLCHAASSYLQPLGITCRQDVQDSWPEIEVGAQKRHGLLNAFKEALQNVVKHSGASGVTLTLRLDDDCLFLALEDNGRGLPAQLGGREKDGLDNMAARLAELGGTCQVCPGAGGGTLVEMRLPL